MTTFQRGAEELLIELNLRIRHPCQGTKRVFRLTWDAVEILHQESRGIEMLIEQDRISLEDYAAAFDEIGMPQAAQILRRVLKLIPAEIRGDANEQTLGNFLSSRYEELTDLTCEVCDACLRYTEHAAQYVRENRDDFEIPQKQ